MFSHFHCYLIHNSQTLETNEMPVGEWVKKMCYIHVMKYYSVVKKIQL